MPTLRPIVKKHIPFPKGTPLPDSPAISLEHVYHTPGQTAAIRFFAHDSFRDFQAMRAIVANKQVRKWMDYAGKLSKSEYKDWAGTHTDSQFLFAVLDARGGLSDLNYVRGFVYIYSDREEKFRIKRMEKQGFLKPATGKRHCLEVSFALKPPKPGMHSGSGLMSSALRQACLQVRFLLSKHSEKTDIILFAHVDTDNLAGQRTLESAGFVRKGKMKYDSDSPEAAYLYFISWRKLLKKIREKLFVLQ